MSAFITVAFYEDKVMERITERNFEMMSGKYQKEQLEIEARLVSRFSMALTAFSSFTAISAKQLMSARTALNKSLASILWALHSLLPFLA